MNTNPTNEHKEQGPIPHSELLARLQDALHVARVEGAASLSADTFAAAISALSSRDAEIREVLEELGKKRQFDRLCFCDTVAQLYCVAQPRCVAARALYAKLQPR